MKLKKLREAIKEWRRNSYKSTKSQISNVRNMLDEIHVGLIVRPLDPVLHKKEADLQTKLGF